MVSKSHTNVRFTPRPQLPPAFARYSTYTELEGGRIGEVGTGKHLAEEVAFAKRWKLNSKLKTWVVDRASGETVWPRPSAAGGAS